MTELTDGSIRLRQWRLDDAEWYAAQAKDVEILRYTTESPDLTGEQVRAAITAYAKDSLHLGWVVCAAGTGERLGNAALDMSDGEISYWVAAAARGRGVASAAVRLMAAHAFAISTLAQVCLWVRTGNAASARVALKAGFTRTPSLDRTRQVKGEQWDTEYYTLPRPAPTAAPEPGA